MSAHNRQPFRKASDRMSSQNGKERLNAGDFLGAGLQFLDEQGNPVPIRISAIQVTTPVNDLQIQCLMAAHLYALAPVDQQETTVERQDRIAKEAFGLFASVVVQAKDAKELDAAFIATRKRVFADPRDQEPPKGPRLEA